MAHLLKHEFQAEKRSGSWLATIREQRYEIAQLLDESPSNQRLIPGQVSKAYRHAMQRAADETGLPESAFPPATPWSPEQILNPEFLP
jgi:hypothetical protein